MKNKFKYAAAAVVFIACACSSSETTATPESSDQETVVEESNESSPAENQTLVSDDVEASKFKELIELGNCNIVDVRTPDEFIEGKIEGAINIDFNGDEFESEIGNLDRNTPVLVYCQAGGRSGKAKAKMETLGFKEIYNLVGGYGSWPYK